MTRHRLALQIIAVAGLLDIAGGLGFAAAEHISSGAGLYWALSTATTVGYGDLYPRTATGHVITVLVMLTVIPLFAATFSLLTSGLTAGHVEAAEQRIRDHIEARLKHHLGDPDE